MCSKTEPHMVPHVMVPPTNLYIISTRTCQKTCLSVFPYISQAKYVRNKKINENKLVGGTTTWGTIWGSVYEHLCVSIANWLTCMQFRFIRVVSYLSMDESYFLQTSRNLIGLKWSRVSRLYSIHDQRCFFKTRGRFSVIFHRRVKAKPWDERWEMTKKRPRV
jgi:hypothetical protein